MTSVSPYTPSFHFPSDPAPLRKINDLKLQAELHAISEFAHDLTTALQRVIRDDDTLVDQLVRLRNLHPELLAWFVSHLEGTQATQSIKYTYPVRAVSTSNILNLANSVTVDGVAMVTGDRLLVAGQTDETQNGIYIVDTSHPWLRAPDLPHGVVADPRFGVTVSEGTVYGETAWRLSPVHQNPAPPQPLVGVHPIRFVQVFGPFPLPISRGGTGATTAAGARANLQATTRFVATWTANGTATSHVFNISGVLNATECTISVYRQPSSSSTWELTYVDTEVTPTTITLIFMSPPAAGDKFRVVAVGL